MSTSNCNHQNEELDVHNGAIVCRDCEKYIIASSARLHNRNIGLVRIKRGGHYIIVSAETGLPLNEHAFAG